MNTETGQIAAIMAVLAADLEGRGRTHSDIEAVLKPIDPANLSPRNREQLERTGRTQISRNSPCPCGSRKRFKRCCMTADESRKR